MKRRDGVRLRGGVWYVRLPSGKSGVRSEEATTAKSRKEAAAIRQKRLVQLREGQYEPDAVKTRAADLIADLVTDYRINGRDEKYIGYRWAHLAPVFGNDLAAAITMPRLTRYVEQRLAEGATPSTVQRELAALRRAFTLGFKAGKVFRVPPFPTIIVRNAREVYFERDELERLLVELGKGRACDANEFMQPLVTVAYWIGFRRGELLKLEWRQLDLDKGTVRLGVGTTKNKEGRLAYLPIEALAALRSWREHTTTVEKQKGMIIARVFHRDGVPVDHFPYESWHSACRRAGIPGRRPHDFRRTMARNYRRSGEAEGVIMKIGGWKTRSVFERYNIVAEDDLRRAAERVVDTRNGAGMGQVVLIETAKKVTSS